MHNEYFQISNDSGIAHLQLNRPDRFNTMGLAFFSGLRDAVLTLDDVGDTRALVVSSTGKHFSAGMALDVFTSATDVFDNSSPRARLGFQHALRNLMDCFDTLDQVRFPVICAIQGGASAEASISPSPATFAFARPMHSSHCRKLRSA